MKLYSSLVALTVVVASGLGYAADESTDGSGAASGPAPVASQPAPEAHPKRVLLRLKLPVGQKIRQLVTVEDRQTTVGGKSKDERIDRTSLSFTSEVLTVSPNGDIRFRHTIDKANLTISPDENSRSRVGGPAAWQKDADKIFAGLKGRSFQSKVSQHGRVLAVMGVPELVDGMSVYSPKGSPRMAASLVGGLLEINDMPLRMTEFLPVWAVGAGSTWMQPVDIGEAGPIPTRTKYTLARREHGVATVELRVVASAPSIDSGVKSAPGLAFVTSYSGTGGGAAQIDEATGLARQIRLKWNGVWRVYSPTAAKKLALSITTHSRRTTEILSTPVP